VRQLRRVGQKKEETREGKEEEEEEEEEEEQGEERRWVQFGHFGGPSQKRSSNVKPYFRIVLRETAIEDSTSVTRHQLPPPV
jgi:hypothetical protein